LRIGSTIVPISSAGAGRCRGLDAATENLQLLHLLGLPL
jgi:hypothetical protein